MIFIIFFLLTVCRFLLFDDTKIQHSLFKLLYYSFSSVTGLFILAQKPFFYDLKEIWSPFRTLDDDILFYYSLSFGYYLHQILVGETWKKDYFQIMIHHIATLFLLGLSFYFNFTQIGSLILLLHDVADPFLELAKIFNYLQYKSVAEFVFFIFSFVFFVTRILIFPFYLIMEIWMLETKEETKNIFLFLLLTLYCLHILWFSTIVKMMVKFFQGTLKNDDRSDSDDDSN